MATLYFNGEIDSDWNTLGNWWLSDPTLPDPTQATNLPTSSDSVVVQSTVDTNSGDPITIVNLTVEIGLVDVSITATGTATFNGGGNNGAVDGDAIFNSSTYNTGTLLSNATFNDSSSNDGNIAGNVTFNDMSINNTNGTIDGNVIFNDDSINFAGLTTFIINRKYCINGSSLLGIV